MRRKTLTRSLDAEFFDSEWLMRHRDWFDPADCGAVKNANRFQATPSVMIRRRVSKPDNRLPIYWRPSENVMVAQT